MEVTAYDGVYVVGATKASCARPEDVLELEEAGYATGVARPGAPEGVVVAGQPGDQPARGVDLVTPGMQHSHNGVCQILQTP